MDFKVAGDREGHYRLPKWIIKVEGITLRLCEQLLLKRSKAVYTS